MVTEVELLAAIAATPDDPELRAVYADWLIARGDERGDLMSIDLADREGRELSDLEPLLRLAAVHGFPRWPDDPIDALLSVTRRPVETYYLDHGRASCRVQYYARQITTSSWLTDAAGARASVAVDVVTSLDLRDPARWDAHHTDVFLSIVGRAMRLGRELDTIEFPRRGAIEDLERYARKRPAHYHQALGMQAPGRPLRPDPAFGVIDYERWGELWLRRETMRRR